MTDLTHYTEGVCADGAAILRDGVMMPIEEIVFELNSLTALAQPAPPAEGEVGELGKWLRELGAKRGGVFDVSTFCANLDRAADLLEQRHPAPVPVVYAPTDEELLELADDSDMDRLEGERGYPDGTVIKEGYWEAWDHQLLAFARAVLAKYGTTPVPTPVPVSERLPDASDPGECRMPDGDCWWFDPHADGAWYFDTYQGNYTHWLPAHALPLPAGEVQP